jgi:hypothetical protein
MDPAPVRITSMRIMLHLPVIIRSMVKRHALNQDVLILPVLVAAETLGADVPPAGSPVMSRRAAEYVHARMFPYSSVDL